MENDGYRCDLCNIGFGSLRELLRHKRGNNHQRKRGDASLKNIVTRVIDYKEKE